MQFDAVQKFFLWAVPTLFAITLHEVAHGWLASMRGDKTAARLGRLSLNPLRHIDLFGTIILPIITFMVSGFIFGWAKPVPVDWRNLKSPRRDMALVAMAGPLANLCMALIWGMIAKIALSASMSFPWASFVITQMATVGIMVNLMFLFFNLIPIPPLDGSRVVLSILPGHLALRYGNLERYGFLIVALLLMLGVFNKIVLPLVLSAALMIAQMYGLN